jgi:hypothetical protein
MNIFYLQLLSSLLSIGLIIYNGNIEDFIAKRNYNYLIIDILFKILAWQIASLIISIIIYLLYYSITHLIN